MLFNSSALFLYGFLPGTLTGANGAILKQALPPDHRPNYLCISAYGFIQGKQVDYRDPITRL